VRTSSLDQLALDLMARDRKSQDAAREQQRLEELQARQQREAAKLAASAQSRPSADASGRSPARPESALPVPVQPATTASDDDQALKSEVERLRAELKARQSGDPSKPAAESGAVYRQTMITLVGARLRYPAEAQASLEEGSDMVRVRVQRNGLVLSATVVQRSGYPLLDSEAEAVFSRIGRFAPVPADISPGSAEIDFTLPIRFKLADN
jgi:protein TonB